MGSLHLGKTPFERQVEVVEGDFFKDPIPSGCDVVLIAQVIHQFTPGQNLELLRRTRERVKSSARLLLVDLWTDPTHTQPTLAALLAGDFLLISGGDVYSEEEVRGWLNTSGWKFLERRPLAGPGSLIVAQTAER